jgi:lipoate-protein ligase A
MYFVENNSTDAAFYFSIEELFTRYIRSSMPVFMLWQTERTVMLGNNQVVASEVDIDYALENGIKVVRRSSGGGAIYTDPGTFLYSVIEPVTKEIKTHREEVAATIIEALYRLGVSALREGRNDILIDGKKISGFAQYTSGNHVCTHGSLLYDTDLDTLTNVLIPNDNKLRPKGIASIRSRVTNIRPYISENYPASDFKVKLIDELVCNRDIEAYNLSTDEYAKINRISQEKYSNHVWNLSL